ncbi:gag protease polyprotein [Cucumis melo var. makuwa]|uniref:Gag protease polyprotein n=1 Tax=Cucumis melo var. makuwa TaxID=1194695 RepID=A0A5A7VAK4_CUCMM|nr:gag protease polyprotein [Cucumis melo var. makuwa]TYK20598.1 gag protease polyprotein [Cucumis melo var. makuwa]
MCTLCSSKTSIVLGVPLDSPKTGDVPTKSHIAHVQECASLGEICRHVEVHVEVVGEAEELDVSSRKNNQLYKLPTLQHLSLIQTLLQWSKDDPTKVQIWLTFVETLFSLRYAKQQEFLDLKQGDMTVEKFYVEFDMLSRFAPDVVRDEAVRIDKFVSFEKIVNPMFKEEGRVAAYHSATEESEVVEFVISASNQGI